MAPTLVTGGYGYVASQLIADLARRGQPVRATARSTDRETDIRAALARAGVEDAELEVVAAELTSPDGWAAAMAGVEEVHHVASPMIQSENPDEVIVPAREGTLNVLRAARDAGVHRVVLTSSFAAIGYSPKPVRDYDESDWTDPDTPRTGRLPPAPRRSPSGPPGTSSRPRAGDTELVVVNPTFVLGPTLTGEIRSSLTLIKMMLEGTMKVVPRQNFGLADVRDVADVHLRAMATPEAAGQRFLVLADGPTMTFLDLAQTLRAHLGPLGERTPTEQAPGDELAPLIIHNERAKSVLGFEPPRGGGDDPRDGCEPAGARVARPLVPCRVRQVVGRGARSACPLSWGVGPGTFTAPQIIVTTSTATPRLIARSARFMLPVEPNSWIQSITPPRNGPGDPPNRSTRFPIPPPSSRPRPRDAPRERMRAASAARARQARIDSAETSSGRPVRALPAPAWL